MTPEDRIRQAVARPGDAVAMPAELRDWTGGPDGERHVDIVARTLWGEVRGEPADGQVAVAWVIRNRADRPGWWGQDPAEVCKVPLQFSCWWDMQAPSLRALTMAVPRYAYLRSVTQRVLSGSTPDPTGGAVNYHTVADPGPAVRGEHWPPAWAAALVPTVRIGSHQFYREKA